MMKKKKKYILLVLGVLIISLISLTLAKYITEDYHGYYINAKDFTFTSNILSNSAGQNMHVIDNWSGVGAFDVTFDLSTKRNNLYYMDYDVPYEVYYDCPDTVVCTLSKTSGVIYASDPTHTDTVTLHVQPIQTFYENTMLVFSVAAKSTFPYEKNLNATFCYFVAHSGLSYTITDYGPVYAKLTITNAVSYCTVNEDFGDYEVGDLIDIEIYKGLTSEEKAKCTGTRVEISFDPNDLLIDTTDNVIEERNFMTTYIGATPYIDSLETEIAPMSAIDIKFYKTDPTANYTYTGANQSAISVTQIN